MAIDFCVDYRCEAKEHLGTHGLLELTRARVAFEATQRAGARRGEADFWTRVVRGPEKDHVEMVTVGHLRRKSNRLIEFTAACSGCPANVTGRPAGCFGRVTYPIDAATERGLAVAAEVLTRPHVTAPARAFVQWIEDGPVDGARVRRMRAAVKKGVRFFELTEPVAAGSLGGHPGQAPPVTTDQIIELLFFSFPGDGRGFHFAVPHAALGGHRAFFEFILDTLDLGHRRAELERSTTLGELRWYARAVQIADGLGVDLLVD